MIRTLTVSLAIGAVSLACAQDSRPTTQPAKKKSGLPALGAPAGVYGAGVSKDEGAELKDVYAKPKDYAGKELRLEGKIEDVCRKKGCWMVLKDGDAEVRVKFKDYAFFVPRDSSGRHVIIQGVAKAETISEEIAKHYAEEGGDPEKAKTIKGPQTVVSFMATGVEILGSNELPPMAEAKGETSKALAGKLGSASEVAAGVKGHKVGDYEAALNRLRAVKGSRHVEFTHRTESDGHYVFGTDASAPFASGFAVKADGTVVKF